MSIRKTILTVTACLLAATAIGQHAANIQDAAIVQTAATVSDSAFHAYMTAQKNAGNDCCRYSDRRGIRRAADTYAAALESRTVAGRLTADDEAYYAADLWKLEGDYWYEQADYAETAADRQTAYAEAEKWLLKYRDCCEARQTAHSARRGLNTAHRELSQLYYKQGRYAEAAHEMKAALNGIAIFYQDDDEPYDVMAQYAICLARTEAYDQALDCIGEVLANYADTTSARYAEALRKKAKILMLAAENGREADTAGALDCYRTYFGLKKRDALQRFMAMNSSQREQYWMHIRPFVTDCYRLEDADAGLLYDVTLFAKGLLLQLDSAGGGRQDIHTTWQNVQRRLRPDDCAVEFVQYEKRGQQQMGALVLKPTGRPVFVRMTQPDSIWQYRLGDYTVADRLERTDLGNYYAIDRVYNDSTGLYRLIWNAPLLTAIGDSHRICFAPDGYAHRIAIEYMLPAELAGRTVRRLSSTRRLLDTPESVGGGRALLVGDVDYDRVAAFSTGDNDALAYQKMRHVRFGRISDSRAEVDAILQSRADRRDTLLCGAAASEQAFRTLCGQYPIVHVSTHGKFAADSTPLGTDLKQCLTDETLSENIIALAGINAAVADDGFQAESCHDGILSAREMASLDMRHVRLVVLACCESGLGRVTPDGVYGMQRGLRNAGAGALIMSLWEADSEFTGAFMAALHRYINEGKSVGDAFWQTRRDFLSLDEYEPSSRDVFILVDALD